jgi:pimeloyl-ACP methyl ester carboxylesterase
MCTLVFCNRATHVINFLDDLFPIETSASPVVYLPSLTRPKNEAKAANLQSWCRKNEHSFLCADYFGVGRSSGKFTEGSVGRWAADTILLIENTLKPPGGKQHDKAVLVGHGVGAWVAFIVTMKRPDLVGGYRLVSALAVADVCVGERHSGTRSGPRLHRGVAVEELVCRDKGPDNERGGR